MGIGYELEPISTHAPLAGRDNACCRCSSRRRNFNPRAPCGARQCKARFKVSFGAFQPTRPLRGATLSSNKTAFLQIFQPTRPLRGATRVDSEMQEGDGISTHAPLAGRDDCTVRAICKATGFQPTRPLRGATAAQDAGHDDRGNFNPRAPCGARRHYSRDGGIDNIFQPTRPLRGATNITRLIEQILKFQPTRPLRGATHVVLLKSMALGNFNPRAPCGARQQKCTNHYAHFCDNRQISDVFAQNADCQGILFLFCARKTCKF